MRKGGPDQKNAITIITVLSVSKLLDNVCWLFYPNYTFVYSFWLLFSNSFFSIVSFDFIPIHRNFTSFSISFAFVHCTNNKNTIGFFTNDPYADDAIVCVCAFVRISIELFMHIEEARNKLENRVKWKQRYGNRVKSLLLILLSISLALANWCCWKCFENTFARTTHQAYLLRRDITNSTLCSSKI